LPFALQLVQEEVLEALFQTCAQQQHAQHSSAQTTSTDAGNKQRCSSSLCDNATTTSSSSSMAGLLVEKLYKHKLRALLQQQSTTLLRCRACGQLFASASHHTLQCPVTTNTSAKRCVTA
jgi:rubrerythrin